MAKRYSSNKGRNIEPAVQTVLLSTSVVAAGTTGRFTADLSQIASLMNRRFYRQGINWAVAGFKILTNGVGAVSIQKLPNTWTTSNAWTKSFKAWQKMNNEALAETESVRPKFLDFKIYADQVHHQAGYAANLLPADAAGAFYTPGEWEASKFQIPDSTSPAGVANAREIIAVGANYPGAGASGLDAVSMIEGYAASRALPMIVDPNMPGDAHYADGPIPQNWIAATFNQGTEQDTEVLDDMATDNNKAPYPFENDGVHTDTMYPGGANQAPTLQVHDFEFITGTTIGGTTRMKGGNFPCGLVRFEYQNTGEVSANIAVQIDLIPGNHRGYLCEPMMEM